MLFVVPPYLGMDEINTGEPESWFTSVTVPLGVISIAAYVGKYADVNFSVLDLNVSIAKHADKFMCTKWEDFLKDELSEFLKKETPDVVGISAIFNSQIGYIDKISTYSKEFWPKTIVVSGGGGVGTSMSSEVFERAPKLDAIATGEAEIPVLNLFKAPLKLEYLEEGKGGKQEIELSKVNSSCRILLKI